MSARGIPARRRSIAPLRTGRIARSALPASARASRPSAPTACRSSTIAPFTGSSVWRSRGGSRVGAGDRVLDVGCGIGRWSRQLAGRGARVTGVDLSPTMITEARRRAGAQGLGADCRFLVADLAQLDLGERFDLVLGVTVLQHILDTPAFDAALAVMAGHLAPGGRMILLEAAPTRQVEKCNTSVFVARPRERYLEAIRANGLEVRAIAGVDPAPFRRDLLPLLGKTPRALRPGLLWLATAASLPVNALFGRAAVESSWHAVFVLERPGTCRDAQRPLLGRRRPVRGPGRGRRARPLVSVK